ncbi:hypothetical protein PIB30_025769 [Stylosanthes scabra]|uniref:Uncharacterized protein n=1 Tax=Stylosanthes scabra TaxID=79078 RepID=A0ABU6SBI2_9FABA|nr:hypothetical protein [Stylosanthes scabra]
MPTRVQGWRDVLAVLGHGSLRSRYGCRGAWDVTAGWTGICLVLLAKQEAAGGAGVAGRDGGRLRQGIVHSRLMEASMDEVHDVYGEGEESYGVGSASSDEGNGNGHGPEYVEPVVEEDCT